MSFWWTGGSFLEVKVERPHGKRQKTHLGNLGSWESQNVEVIQTPPDHDPARQTEWRDLTTPSNGWLPSCLFPPSSPSSRPPSRSLFPSPSSKTSRVELYLRDKEPQALKVSLSASGARDDVKTPQEYISRHQEGEALKDPALKSPSIQKTAARDVLGNILTHAHNHGRYVSPWYVYPSTHL
ncbi:hypothetical protein DFH06DRAFT_1198030, partial [Mycena polygramma]